MQLVARDKKKKEKKSELTLQSILSSTDICKAPVVAVRLRGIERVEPSKAPHLHASPDSRRLRRRGARKYT